MNIKVSDYIIQTLVDNNIKDVFIFAGGGAMHLNDSIGNNSEINYVCCLHEQACAISAESYARSRNNIGVAVVTTGPGATNTLTGVAASWIESTPLLIITGQVKRSDLMNGQGVRQFGVQEVDIVSMAKPITKYSILITDPLMVRYELEKCLYLANSGRKGPVLLDIPLDIQGSFINPQELQSFTPELECKQKYALSDASIQLIYQLLSRSKRPVIYVGAGVYFADAQSEFIELIEKLNIPVLTTWNGMDLLWEDHPLYVGRPGAIGQRAANFVIQNSDLLLTIGTRLSPLQTGFDYNSFARNAKHIMIDIDSNELDKSNLNPYLKIQADAKLFLTKMVSVVPAELPAYNSWIDICRKWNKLFPTFDYSKVSEGNYINSYHLVDELSSQMQADDIYCGGRAGTCIDTVIHSFKVKKGQKVLATKGLSSMGYGLPASIGASIANPAKRIICINGDGGFVMNIQELETVKRLNLPIKFFILDNHGYATIVSTQTNVFNSNFVACTKESGLSIGNIASVANAYGIKTFIIQNPNELRNIIEQTLNFDGPVVCVANVCICQPIEPRQCSFKNDEGQMQSRPLEDMKPLLDRELLMDIMNQFK